VALKLDAAGIESYYPHALIKSRDGKRSIERRFMPGYVFAYFDLAEKTAVVAIPQVAGILGFGRHAVSIPNSEIEQVKKIVSFPNIAMPCQFFAAGNKVRVRYGPLTGLEGYVMRWKKKAWVVVTLTSAECSIKAEVDPQSLELINPQGKAA